MLISSNKDKVVYIVKIRYWFTWKSLKLFVVYSELQVLKNITFVLAIRMSSNEAYVTTEDELRKEKRLEVDLFKKNESSFSEEEHVYNYEDALELTGNGCYNFTLLCTLSCTILAMGIDMFGFSVIVSGCACEFELTTTQRSIMMSMPFLGPVFMSYPWGYISDTKGRRKSLIVAMWASFVFSVVGAFSNSWIMLAVFRFLSTSFCSCAQSSTYVLLGESCQQKARGSLMLVMTSLLMLGPPSYILAGYLTLNLEFFYDIGILNFVPWRLLTLILALPLGISAISLMSVYESPKFLLNMGFEVEALENLKNFFRRNGGDIEKFPVKKLLLIEEDGKEKQEDISLWESMKQQTVPLFKPPLLLRTLKLFYLTKVAYGTNNGFLMWFPSIVNAFVGERNSPTTNSTMTVTSLGLCDTILKSQSHLTEIDYVEAACNPRLEFLTSMSGIAYGCVFATINFSISMLASRKKALCICVFLISAVSGVGTALVKNDLASLILFVSFLLTGMCTGLLSSYYVSLFPTSYRGMASCLAVMVGRASALASTNVVGAIVMSDCKTTFFSWSIYVFSAFVVSCFLPPDRPTKKV